MKSFMAIVELTDGVITKYQELDTEDEAEKHIEKYGGYVVATPADHLSDDVKFYIFNNDTKTVTFDKSSYDTEIHNHNMMIFRRERNERLEKSDNLVYPDRWAAMNDDTKTAWTNYRQALRDLPANTADPTDVTWPTKPS